MACLGIAVGIGFYTGAILTTSFVLIILIIFSKVEYMFYGKSGKTMITIKAQNIDGQVDMIGEKLKEFEMFHNKISVEPADNNLVSIRIKAVTNRNISNTKLIEELYKVSGVNYVEICD